MKITAAIYTTTLLSILAITGFTSLFLSQQGDPYEEIMVAFSKGDSKILAQYLDEQVELIFLEEADFYSKTEAEQLLEDFFVANPPKSFAEIHRGQSANKKSTFIIGNLETGTSNFRTKIVISYEKIVEIDFEKSKQFTQNEL